MSNEDDLIGVILGDSDLVSQASSLIARHEGVRLKPYIDTVGKMTIGIGRNLSDNGISYEEAMVLFKNDLAKVMRDLAKLPWFVKLDTPRKLVLIDMAFNLGFAGLMKFKRTLHSIATGNYVLAADQMLQSKWARQVGMRSQRLAHIMRTGTL